MIGKGDLLSQGDQVFKVLAVIERPCLKLQNVGNEMELEVYQDELSTQGYKVHHKAEDVTDLINRIKALENDKEIFKEKITRGKGGLICRTCANTLIDMQGNPCECTFKPTGNDENVTG